MSFPLRIASCALLLLLGCSEREDLDGRRRVVPGSNTEQSAQAGAEQAKAVPEPRGPSGQETSDGARSMDLYAARPLLLGYRRGALVIDAGSAAFAKFVDGGIRRDWHRGLELEDAQGLRRRASAVKGLAAELYFPIDGDPGGIQKSGQGLRIQFWALSAVENQLVSIFVNEKKIRDLRMPKKEWVRYSLNVPAEALRDGENKLRFYFRATGKFGELASAAAFAQFVIGDSISEEAPFDAKSFVAGGNTRRALVVPAGTRLSAHLLVPAERSRLRFAFAGKGKASIRIREAGEKETREAWTQAASEAKWDEDEVSLDRYRGRLVRIDFANDEKMAWASLQVRSEAKSFTPASRPVPKHIILWSVSSLRSDRLRRGVGRTFRRFAEEGFAVEESQSSAPAAGGAHASAMSGRLRARGSIPESYSTLAEELQQAGYATALFSGNGFVNDEAGFAQGFDRYDNPMRRQHHFGARTLWRQASRFLQAHKKQRSFVHVVTVEPHVPYRPSDEALAKEWVLPAPFAPAKTLNLAEQISKGRRRLTTNEQSYVRALYDACVADADSAFAAMLDEIKELGLVGEVAIILSGDHGEELWERSTFGHGSSLYQESLRTPLVISLGSLNEQAAPKWSSSIDLMPTILDLAGLTPAPELEGRSLLGDPSHLDARPTLAAAADGSRSLRWGIYKLIHLPAGHLRLYDLAQDPSEQNDLASSRPVITRALRNLLSIALANESNWSTARWGSIASPNEAFARDQGL